MSKFNILLCEDKSTDRSFVGAYITNLKKQYPELDIQLETLLADQVVDEQAYKNYSLLILDMYHDDERKGEDILNLISLGEEQLPTLIYTNGSRDGNPIDYLIVERYPFVEEIIIKGEKGVKLTGAIVRIISRIAGVSKFELSDEDDLVLKASVAAIGRLDITEVLHQFWVRSGITDKYTLYRMASGFSGASLFRVSQGAKQFVLKISREKKQFRAELDNAKGFYKRFPFRIDVGDQIVETKEVIAALIEEVKGGSTLYEYIAAQTEGQISNLLQELYFNTGLSQFFENNMSTDRCKYDAIFKRFDFSRHAWLQAAIKDLRPILDSLQATHPFEEHEIKAFLLTKTYKAINATALLNDSYKKPLVLCHGDFHSNNIMVQGGRPVIIDTGNVGYGYWSTDICRLIVHLFIAGFDKNHLAFFETSSIPRYFDVVRLVVDRQEIPLDGRNDPFIVAINWLTEHISAIHGAYFSLWEFQLGLMKEFVQMSYRTDSVPPSKRALSLLAAYHCLVTANTSLTGSLNS